MKGPTRIVHHKEWRRIIFCSSEAVVLEQKLVLRNLQYDGDSKQQEWHVRSSQEER